MNDVEALVVSGRIEMEARQGVASRGKARQVRRPRRAPDHRRPRRCGRASRCPVPEAEAGRGDHVVFGRLRHGQ